MPKELWLLIGMDSWIYSIYDRILQDDNYSIHILQCIIVIVRYTHTYIYSNMYIYIYDPSYMMFLWISGDLDPAEAPRLQREVPCDHGTQRPAEALLVALVALQRQWQALRVAVLGLLTGSREAMSAPQISGGKWWCQLWTIPPKIHTPSGRFRALGLPHYPLAI